MDKWYKSILEVREESTDKTVIDTCNAIIKKYNEYFLVTCKLCGRRFKPNRSDAMYCNILCDDEELYIKYPNKRMDETCKQYNARVASFENYINDPINKEIRNIKQRIRARIRRGAETEEYLNEWILEMKLKRKELNYDVFLNWLKISDIHSKRKEK